MASQEFMAVLLRVGDTIRWLSPEADDLVEVKVTAIRYSTPIAGKMEVVTDGLPRPLRLSSRSIVNVMIPPRK